MSNKNSQTRNVAIIAHVDHGKTSLVDQLLRQSDLQKDHGTHTVRLLDCGDLEKERGITIMAKCTSIDWGSHRFNIVDTPGHADFGGEVERVLGMVDGALVLVDASEGPLPQTKFVLTKALEQGLKLIVVINKVDRPDGRPLQVLDEMLDLFISLNASDEQLDFPVIYSSAKEGWAINDLSELNNTSKNISPIFQTILDKVPFPSGNIDAPFQMLVSNLDYNSYIGRILIGRIHNGKAKVNMPVHVLNIDGEVIEQGRLTKIFRTRGLTPTELDTAECGDIISISGLSKATVSNTICSLDSRDALPSIMIDPPTISMSFSVNDSPLSGKSGTKLTSGVIRERLNKEMESNISIIVTEKESKDAFEVEARGELQLGILIETLRREGFELSIGRPKVLYKIGDRGEKLEPIEELVIDVDEDFSGIVIEKIGLRKGELFNMVSTKGNKSRLTFLCPARGLIGYRGEFLTDTRGTGIMNRSFHGYAPYKGPIGGRRTGVLIANADGKATAYSLSRLEDRGTLFVDEGVMVYAGQIIGQHNRENDLEVNVIEGKKLSNMRSTSKDDSVKLTPYTKMTLEQGISYIEPDEMVEVTPDAIRLRKAYLDSNERKRKQKSFGDV